jgi:DNA-binding MarR family transcriptional regulator
MPISADRFEEIDEDEDGPAPGTNAHEILSFLESNPEKAFTQTEIVEATGVARGSVGPTLVRLREAGRVDHRATYWRVSDHARSLDAALGHAGDAVEDREDAPLDPGQWQAFAVDPRDDRE